MNMSVRSHPWGVLFVRAYRSWKDDRVSFLAGALAYYAVFSLAPLLVVLLAAVGLFYGRNDAQAQVAQTLVLFLGEPGALLAADILAAAARIPHGLGAIIVGAAVTFFGSVALFARLQEAVHIIWDVKSGIRSWRRALLRQVSLFFFLVVSVAATVLSIFIGTGIAIAWNRLEGLVGTPRLLLQSANAAVSFALTFALVAVLFKKLPDRPVRWAHVLPATVFTTALLAFGRSAIGLYLRFGGVASAYGAAGSLAAVLVWIYCTAQIFLFGVELVKVRSRGQG